MRLFLLLSMMTAVFGLPAQTPSSHPPAWAKDAIWYQIFVERFRNGDLRNDPVKKDIDIAPINMIFPDSWAVTPWTQNWYKMEPWADKTEKSFNGKVQYRRYGGDLQGVLDKLDYLQELGVNALFLNPINDAPSLHKYDARYYHHVDIHFGPDPEGDKKLIATENPADPSTWKWTAADKQFLRLVDEAHRRGMRLIMDYSWNHTGTLFWAFQDVVQRQEKSAYKDWYDIQSFDNPNTPENEFVYTGWLGNASLPEIRKVAVIPPRVTGRPYEGNIYEQAKQHMFEVARRWLAPDGDTKRGIDGFRLDVADQIGLGFWRDFRVFVRSLQPEAYLVGEIWWEKWPEQMMDPTPYTNKGDIFDAVMFYQAYRPARYFFAKTENAIQAGQMKDSLEGQWRRLPADVRQAMMNVSSSHDAPRLLTCFYNPGLYKYNCSPQADPGYKTGKPDAETYARLRLYLVHLFTSVGAPQIWNGEEMGMWGADDPECRKPLWWKDLSFEPENRYNYQPGRAAFDAVGFDATQYAWYRKLIRLRQEHPSLRTAGMEFLMADGKTLVYRRTDGKETLLVAFNLDKRSHTLSLPDKGSYQDLLTGRKWAGGVLRLPGLTSAVLQKKP